MICEFWERLKKVEHFRFESVCGPDSKTGWSGRAEGQVDVQLSGSKILFYENCRFRLDSGGDFDLKNVYLFEKHQEGIDVLHLRRKEPVFLLTLEEKVELGCLAEKTDHLCGMDHYRLEVSVISEKSIDCIWRITGPKKDEEIVYRYW